MKWLLLLLTPLLFAAGGKVDDSLTIYFFVSEKCPICQYYTKKINQITKDYPNHQFVLIFPNKLSSAETMGEFKKKYKISAQMQLDHDHKLVQKFGATVTPEVVVYNSGENKVLYQGRIDDNYYRVGKRKTKVQSNDLVDALKSISNKTEIAEPKTTPVGCFITQKTTK